jgi:RNA polymerase sigma factor (sigma-70 family)
MKIDQEVVEAACNGDSSALEKLLTRSRPDLKRFARRVCATSEDAEDAVQIALWKLHMHIGTLRTVSAFAVWIFRIVERECFRAFKAGRNTEPMDEQMEASMPAADARDELRQDLIAAIATLPPAYSEILILRDVNEWTAPEAAAYLGITVEAAKSRLHRARSLMRERLSAGQYCVRDAG